MSLIILVKGRDIRLFKVKEKSIGSDDIDSSSLSLAKIKQGRAGNKDDKSQVKLDGFIRVKMAEAKLAIK